MNKLAKGAIAGAAGIALLLGGAGTFAFWNSTADVAGGTITAGDLEVVQDADPGVWANQNGAITDIAAYRIVPGDTLTFTDTVDVTAVGNTLVATLGLAGGSVVPLSGTDPEDVALAGRLQDTAVVTATGPGIVDNNDGTYTVTAAAGTGGSVVAQPVVLTVSIAFPFNGTPAADNPAKVGAVSLEDMAVELTQIVEP